NCCVPEIGLVTAFWPFTTTGPGETVVQTAGETRFVVDCSVNAAVLVGHVRTTLGATEIIVSSGGKEMLNIVPLPELPPKYVIPYKVWADKINPPDGPGSSLPSVKV